MPYTLPPLPYSYDALEPYIDAKTMEVHYTKHHQAYIDKLNEALTRAPELQNKPLEELLKSLNAIPETVRTAIRNQGGGTLNHAEFWLMMRKNGGGEPTGTIAQEIQKKFGAFAAMQEQFNAAAKGVFGSGWTWLCVDKDGQLMITATHNQDTPISEGRTPVLGLDVWEHAYYLKYQNKRPDYITAWWHVINWDYVEEKFRAAHGKK
jgi:superoxide dismutase, Fe-Mn family